MIDLLFGCHHKQLSRPITRAHKPGTPAGLVYVVCLECGKQFHYDAKNMQIGAPVLAEAPASSSAQHLYQTQY